MISYIKWEILNLEIDNIDILTNCWVSYNIFINSLCFSELQNKKEVWLYIYHYITENQQSLFGFLDKKQKDIFKELIKISGIWWKVALQILSLWIDNLILAIQRNDLKIIEQIKWIWKKMAEKVILELKDKDFVKSYISIDNNIVINKKQSLDKNIEDDIISTLVNMWYSKTSIKQALNSLDFQEFDEDLSLLLPQIIKLVSK